MKRTMHPEVIKFLAKSGSAGGKSRSKAKVAAVRESLEKARAKRWAKKKP